MNEVRVRMVIEDELAVDVGCERNGGEQSKWRG